MQLRRHRANIVISAIVIVVLAVAAFLVFQMGASGSSGWAIVHDSDGNETRLDLSDDQTLTITTSMGYNVVRVADGAVSVIEADCPNHDCINQGEIRVPGERVVCLPHQLWIEVEAADTDEGTSGQDAGTNVDTLAR